MDREETCVGSSVPSGRPLKLMMCRSLEWEGGCYVLVFAGCNVGVEERPC